jgi:hypothetical protein
MHQDLNKYSMIHFYNLLKTMIKTEFEQCIAIAMIVIIFFIVSAIEYHDLINNTI